MGQLNRAEKWGKSELGFRPYGDIEATHVGPSAMLCRINADLAHFEGVGCPMVKLAKDVTWDDDVTAGLLAAMPEAAVKPPLLDPAYVSSTRRGIDPIGRSAPDPRSELTVDMDDALLDRSLIPELKPGIEAIAAGQTQQIGSLRTANPRGSSGDVAFLLRHPRMNRLCAGANGLTLLAFRVCSLHDYIDNRPRPRHAAGLYHCMAVGLARKPVQRQGSAERVPNPVAGRDTKSRTS
jgi:hypothetical protein